MNMRRAKTKSGERGSVLVEMAFTLPILTLIFLSIIDLGLVLRQFQLLQNAAREGAHFSAFQVNQIYYATPPPDGIGPDAVCGNIKQFVVNYAAQENISLTYSDITVNQVYPTLLGGGSQITVTHTAPLLLVGAPFLNAGSVTLSATSVFQNFYGLTDTTLPPGGACP